MNASPEQAGPEVGGRFQVPVDGALFNGIRAREIKEGWGISETAPSDEAYADLREDGGTFADRLENDIAATQAALERMERQQPSDTMPKDNLVYENRPISLKLFTSADLAEAGAGAAINPQSYRESGKRAQEELRKEAAEPHLSTRIKNLKSALAEAEGNQEEFRTKALQEELDKAREELQAIYLKRTKDIERGVAALEAQDAAFEEASRPDPEKIGKDWSGMLQRLNGQEVPSEPATPVEPVEPAAPSEPSKPHVPGAADESAPGVLTETAGEPTAPVEVVEPTEPQDAVLGPRETAPSGSEASESEESGSGPESESEPITAHSPETAGNKLVIRSAVAEASRRYKKDAHVWLEDLGLYAVVDGAREQHDPLLVAQNVAEGAKLFAHFTEKKHGSDSRNIEAAGALLRGVFGEGKHSLNNLTKRAKANGEDLDNASAAVAAVATVEQADGTHLAWRSTGSDPIILLYRDGNVTRINEEQIDEDDPNRVKNKISSGWHGSEDVYGSLKLYPGDKILVCSEGITGDWSAERLTRAEWAEGFSQPTPDAVARWFVQNGGASTALVLSTEEDGSMRNIPTEPAIVSPWSEYWGADATRSTEFTPPAPYNEGLGNDITPALPPYGSEPTREYQPPPPGSPVDSTVSGSGGRQEHNTSRRRRITRKLAAGVLSVIVIPPVFNGVGGEILQNLPSGTASAQEQNHSATPPKEAELTVTDTLEQGETVIGAVRKQIQRLDITMEKNVLDEFLRQQTDAVMQLNGWDDTAVRNLPVGQIIKLLSDEKMLKAAQVFTEDTKRKITTK
ncbi:hypothetical protein CR973_01260 [Candidatus Saccharibacteria bacterium]|nr:MAG: hypothetical protein CR973_01260 [Candidatus Saccharibacteria bacterium]